MASSLDDLLVASPRRESLGPVDDITIPLSGPLAREAISQALAAAFAPTLSSSTISDIGGPPTGAGGLGGQWVLKCRLVNSAMELSPATRARRSSSGRGSLPSALSSTWREDKASEERDDHNGGWGAGTGGEAQEDNFQLRAKVNSLRQENDILKYRLAEVEANLKKALTNVKTFHQSQQQLFNDFVLLREKYDEAKSHVAEVLWTYLPSQSKYCPSIPAIQTALVETEKRVGDYDIGDKLGEGQFAKVFKCTRRPAEDGKGEVVMEQSPPEEYALKIINKDKVSSMAALKRVDSEIGAQMTLRHRGILQVHDVVNGKLGLYVVMDKGGKDLFDYFDEKPDRLSSEDCKGLARSIIDAINFCHTQGICHRDLKPENILLNTNTQQAPCHERTVSPTPFVEGFGSTSNIFQVKLCDFGLCSPFLKGQKLNDFCGSPGFFAPEMITCPAYDGPAVDVWSIGCILLELSVGHEIFCDNWMIAYDYELLQDPKRFERKLRECLASLSEAMRGRLELDEPLVDFILGLLAVDPEKRLTIEQIVNHPWIAMEDGRSFLTGDLLPPFSLLFSRSPLSLSNSSRLRSRPAPLIVKNGDGAGAATGAGDAAISPKNHHVSFSISSDAGVENLSLSPIAASDAGQSGNPVIRNSMSHKARTKMEQQKTGPTGETKRSLQLPPLEPQTPAVHAAKRILWAGDEILQKAEESSNNLSSATSPSSMDESRHPAMLVTKERNASSRMREKELHQSEHSIGRPAW